MNQTPKILIVDDEPINVKILQRKLEKAGYEILTAGNGVECLESVSQVLPDLILLDVMMPEMDGVETCKKLKENPDTRSIPVVFVSAKIDRSDKIAGLDSGAIDYISKPVDLEETLARVQTHLKLERMHNENLELQQRLGEVRRNAAIGSMTQGIAHNLNNLLGVIIGYVDLLKLRVHQPEKITQDLQALEKAVKRMVDLVRRLSSMTSDTLVTRIEVNPVNAINQIIRGSTRQGEDEQTVQLVHELPSGYRIHTSLEMFENIVKHLMRNAIESYPDNTPAEERYVTITLKNLEENGSSKLQIEVLDQGSGIDPKVADNLFDPFISTKNSVGRGFGLTIVKQAVANLSGSIRMVPNSGAHQGTKAIFTLPVKG